MKVIVNNPNPIDASDHHAHKCNVCGSVKFWTEDHKHIERPVCKGIYGHEVYFITCSDECRKDARDIFIKWLSEYDGWDIKKATENYDKYIANDQEETTGDES